MRILSLHTSSLRKTEDFSQAGGDSLFLSLPNLVNSNVFQRRCGVCRILPWQFRMARNTETPGRSWLPTLLCKVRIRSSFPSSCLQCLVAGVSTVLLYRRLCRRPRLTARCFSLIGLCFLSTAGPVLIHKLEL